MLSFTKQKAENPGIREVMCMTILENGWAFVLISTQISKLYESMM
jgi:hypothetical protein